MIRNDDPEVRVDRIERAGVGTGVVVGLVLGLLLLAMLAWWAVAQGSWMPFGQSATHFCQLMTC